MTARPLNFLSLFAGIGGIDLGLERAGMRCVAQVEIDPFCRKVLAKHWPDVPRFEDVRTVTRETFAALGPIDLIAGGFPCQDISSAGKKAGIGGERSGLWSEFARLVLELRPRFVFVENVPTLLNRGIRTVLGDLARCGYDAEWQSVPASALGAPIGREGRNRLWLVAYPDGGGCGRPGLPRRLEDGSVLAGASGGGRPVTGLSGPTPHHWSVEPGVDRVADGVPDRMDRIAALGNAVVPQVAEWIGRRIVEAA